MTDEERETQAAADYAAAVAGQVDGATLAAAGDTQIRFSDGVTFPALFAALDSFPGQFGNGARPAYAYPVTFMPEIPGDPIELTEAWLIGEGGAACFVLPAPLLVGGGTEGGLDPVVIAAGTLLF